MFLICVVYFCRRCNLLVIMLKVATIDGLSLVDRHCIELHYYAPATDRCQTDRCQTSYAYHRLMPPAVGAGTPPLLQAALSDDTRLTSDICLSDICLSRTLGLCREQRGL